MARIQESVSSTETFIDFINEEEETVLSIQFTQQSISLISGEGALVPSYSYNSNLTHTLTVILQSTRADITIQESNGDGREWPNIALINNLGKLDRVRFRAAAYSPYVMDRLSRKC